MTTPAEALPGTGRDELRYTAFGLELRIDPRIAVPGLVEDDGSSAISNPGQSEAIAKPREGEDHTPPVQPPSHVRLDGGEEVRRRWGALTVAPVRTREVRFGETLIRSVDFAEPAGYLLWAREYGRVLISSDGLELLCEPDPANEDWASIVSSQALPLAATLRGFEVVHASGVVLDGQAVLITGPAGAGKTSLAAALVRIGGALLSDDAVALEPSADTLVAHAGSLALQLRAAEDERLSPRERTALGEPTGSIEGKRRYTSRRTPSPAPFGCLFLLERSMREPVIEELVAVDPFELLASTFNLSVHTPERLRRQLDVVAAIASHGQVYRLRVQPDVDATELAAVVHEHLA